jgi:hypothetical protein
VLRIESRREHSMRGTDHVQVRLVVDLEDLIEVGIGHVRLSPKGMMAPAWAGS